MERASGTVTTFDDRRGIGEVTTEAGQVLAFHCTAVAGGSRTIAEGTAVVVEVAPGLPGRWEAVLVTPA